jgi:uncharacterized circularly permuted ATP-grasp superfamily protein
MLFDEMRGPCRGGAKSATVRPGYVELARWLEQAPAELLESRKLEAEHFFRRIGITFNVYGDAQGKERLIPFDIVPRVLTSGEWERLAKGLEQRVKALNAFIGDVYHGREIVRAGVVPEALVLQNPAFQPVMTRIKPPGDVYVHIAGIDVVRVDADTFYVLEDNARTPSGVSYMLENREAMMRLFPELFNRMRIAPIDNYPDDLLATLPERITDNSPGTPSVESERNASGSMKSSSTRR